MWLGQSLWGFGDSLEVMTGALFTTHDKDSRTVWRTTNSPHPVKSEWGQMGRMRAGASWEG